MPIHRRRSGALLKIGTAAIALSVMLLSGLNAARPDTANADPPDGQGPGTKEISEQFRGSHAPVKLGTEKGLPDVAQGDENRPPKVGDQRIMLALDDTAGFYLKSFTLRATSAGAEAWVANNLDFPAGDCRNDGVRNVVTDAQLAYMLQEFDQNIRPIDVDWFGEPLVRQGKNGALPELLTDGFGLPTSKNAYKNSAGKDIILIDNVRDGNYYDTDNANSMSYIAGFFTTAMPFYLDRNVITIDSYDWVHRTGDDPPHNPTTVPCTSAPARPNLYEGVFAHEYQHLIHSDYDPDEVNWVNEGLSDLAEILTGYSHPERHIDEKGADSHILNFLGWAEVSHPDWNPIPRPAGPENSLTVWEDQGPLEILADYGHAYYFMTYLQSQGYDQAFFTEWAHNPLNGIDGLNDTLASNGSADTFASLFLDTQTAALVDAFVDDGASVTGADAGNVSNDGTNSTIHFTTDAYGGAGAPPWGSDYVPLGPGAGLTSVAFDGDDQFMAPAGPQWVENANGYFSVVPSGNYLSMMDVSITHEVTLGASSMLTFNHYHDTEIDWDFGFVQVSVDGGATWTSVACSGTTTQHDPGAIAPIVANLPGYSGTAGSEGTPLAGTCDLSTSPAGPALIAFRFMSDPAVEQTGWFVKDVQLDGADVGTPGSLAGWNNQKFYDAPALGFMLRLVGVSGDVDGFGHVTNATSVVVVDIPLDGANAGAATAEQIAALSSSDQVFAIVSGIPEVEDNGIFGPYSLLVNGVEAADGAGAVDPW